MLLRSRRTRRPAATIVEMAAVIPIVLLFIFGIFEYGRYVMTRQILENSAREGARWAVVHTYDGSTTAVQTRVDQLLLVARQQMVGYTKETNILVYAADGNGNKIVGKSWQDCAFGELVVVEITGTYKPVLPNLLFMNSTMPISAKAAMGSEAN